MKEAVTSSLTLRLDKWLWFARVVRTRSAATRLCAAGCVTVGGHAAVKPHHPVRIGDRITVELMEQRRYLTVLQLGERRGPPGEARLLYDEPLPPRRREESAPVWTSLFAEEEDAFAADQRLTQSL
jgi:ribosome-associated heat shock protein Hsp15